MRRSTSCCSTSTPPHSPIGRASARSATTPTPAGYSPTPSPRAPRATAPSLIRCGGRLARRTEPSRRYGYRFPVVPLLLPPALFPPPLLEPLPLDALPAPVPA